MIKLKTISVKIVAMTLILMAGGALALAEDSRYEGTYTTPTPIPYEEPVFEDVTQYLNQESNIGAGMALQEVGTFSSIDVSGNASVGGALLTGGTQVELNYYGTGDRLSYIDFHSDDTYTDFGARILRNKGSNGNIDFQNRGSGDIKFFVNTSQEVLNLDASGNVNVGLFNPSSLFHAYGDIKAEGNVSYGAYGMRTNTKQDAGLRGDAGSQSGFFETSNPLPAENWYPGANNWQHLIDVRHSNPNNNYAMQIAGSFFDQDLYFRKTANSPTRPWNKFVVENSEGNVGIGTSTPLAPVHVQGVGQYNHSMYISKDNSGSKIYIGVNNANDGYIGAYDYVGSVYKNLLLSPNGGNVGIGTTTPTEKLEVAGNAKVNGNLNVSGNITSSNPICIGKCQ